MLKSSKLNYLSAILNLQPAWKYKGLKTCPYAGQCASVCLQLTGRNRFDGSRLARERRTKLYVNNKAEFYSLLGQDIEALVRKAKRDKFTGVSVRLNGLSDIPFELDIVRDGKNIFELYPRVQFIDYTKDFTRFDRELPKNYHLTYSLNEQSNISIPAKVFALGYNVAAVFTTSDLPKTMTLENITYPVINGDISDLRHLDPRGCIVGLKFKRPFNRKSGKAMGPEKAPNFVILGQ